MVPQPATRRSILSLGLLAIAGVAIPAAVATAAGDTAWHAGFSEKLAGLCTWMRAERGANGELELHCGIRDAVDWARAFGKLAGKDLRVVASGNVLSFSHAGRPVRVVMHHAS